MSLFAGIDIGTGGVRCLVVDERGARVARAARPWPPRGADPELDPDAVASAVAEATAEALHGLEALDGLAVCSQRSGVVFLDDAGRVISAGSNSDARGLGPGIEQQRAHGEAIMRIAGRLPAFLYMPARLAWLRAERPGDAARVRRALSLGDWIAQMLTGEAATDPTQAAELLVYDVTAGGWSRALLDALEVPEGSLPRVLAPGAPAGTVTAEAAARFGIPQGTPVVPGGADTQAAVLGCGVLDTGNAYVVAGTTMLAGLVLDVPAPDARGRDWLSPHAIEGRWVREAHCGEAGAALDWLSEIMGTSIERLVEEADDGQPGAGGVTFIDAMPSDASDFPLLARAGLVFDAPVLALGRPRADVARAAFEGLAFGARAGLDRLAEHAPPASITVAGGVARAGTFARALAGASDQPVRVATTPDSSALGAAILAAAAHHGGVRAAAEAMADPCRDVAPVAADGYPAHYDAWRTHARVIGVKMSLGGLM